MEYIIPRVLLAGTNSGCGKTTIACAIIQAFVNRKLKTGAFKCGPDYIDPMFHSRIIGAKSTNLDKFFFDDNTLKYLLAKNGMDRDICILEGVMGFYDGMGLTSVRTSTYEISQVTQSPVILVVNAKGASLSVLAAIQGFLDFRSDNRICGVILNQCTPMTYQALAKEIGRHFGGRIKPYGFLPTMPECSIKSRHLGLVTAKQVENLHEKLTLLSQQAEQSIDLDAIISLAEKAEAFCCDPVELPHYDTPIRIAVARDVAFCFYYEDSLEALAEMGAELVSFSPVSDNSLPDDIQGLYLGGGYPELYAKQLSENISMLSSVRNALHGGLPCIAECGGFMYLTEKIGEYPMVGHILGRSIDKEKLTRFGYVTLTAKEDNMLCKAGQCINGHEFHYWDSENNGASFIASKASGRSWECIHAADKLYAGYPHFHFYSNPDFAANFYEACIKEKRRHDRKY